MFIFNKCFGVNIFTLSFLSQVKYKAYEDV